MCDALISIISVFCVHLVIYQQLQQLRSPDSRSWAAPEPGQAFFCSSGQSTWTVVRCKNTSCWVTLLEPAGRAAVLGQPCSLRPYCCTVTWILTQSTHRVAMATFWRTFHHDGKISQPGEGWEGGARHGHPLSLHLPSRTKLQCTLLLRGQIYSPYFYSTSICTLWIHCTYAGILLLQYCTCSISIQFLFRENYFIIWLNFLACCYAICMIPPAQRYSVIIY